MAQTSTSSTIQVEEETKKLIRKLTGFRDAGDENFRRSVQFALSNFRFHRYLDVDSHKITKKVQGLLQKFTVHSQLRKAEALQRLTDKFLSLPLSKKNGDPKTDLHYSILSVLLTLSASPVNAQYSETLSARRQEDREDDFDWGTYLQEDLAPVPSFRDSSSDEWTEEETLDDSAIVADREEAGPATAGPTLTSGAGEEEPEGRGRRWLEASVVVRYWDGVRDVSIAGDHASADLAHSWREYERHMDPFPTVDDRYSLTEMHIIRETIWLLMGAEASFVYSRQGGRFTPRSDIQVSHLTPKALRQLTSRLAEVCSNAHTLQTFVDQVREKSMAYIGTGDSSTDETGPTSCQTYESFAEALSTILSALRKELTVLEKDILKQEESITLSRFADELESWAEGLSLLSHVYAAGIAECQGRSSAQRTWQLLRALEGAIQGEYEQGMHREKEVQLLLRVWLVTIRPYVHCLDGWLSGSPLYDPAQEFVIQRNPDITVKSPAFWEKAFTLHRFATPEVHGTARPSHADGQRPAAGTASPRRREGRPEGRAAAPAFLQPVLGEILLAGKCMELLESMGQLPMVWKKYHPEKRSVYEAFSAELEGHLGAARTPADAAENPPARPGATEDGGGRAAVSQSPPELEGLDLRDPLMAQNAQDLLGQLEYFCQDPDAKSSGRSSRPAVDASRSAPLQPLPLLLHRRLYPPLLAKCRAVCGELVTTLKRDYHLLGTLASLRRFYLCEAGDTMFDFLSHLFDLLARSQLDSQWKEPLYLTYRLQAAVAAGFPAEAERLSVSFEQTRAPSSVAMQPIHALDGLTLHYKVPWPLDVIISGQTLAVYNQVFRFLLQVKRAKYCLDQLRFSSIARTGTADETTATRQRAPVSGTGPSSQDSHSSSLTQSQLLHRVYLLRFRLVHFVNAVHSYLMSRILHSTGLEFQADVERAADLDSVLAAQAGYLAKVTERCLLHRKVALVREAVVKALNLAVVFQRRWHAGLEAFSAASIEQMLSEFNKCSVFLLTMLNNINKRGAFPHLEALALSLAQSHGEESGDQT